MTEKQHLSVFSNLLPIINLSTWILEEFQEDTMVNSLATSDNLPKYSEIITSKFDPIVIAMNPLYDSYCASQAMRDAILSKIMRENKSFVSKLEELQSNTRCRCLDLQAFLIMPVQRICRYPLLFKEALKTLPEDHSCRKPCEKILKRLRKIAAKIDKNVKRHAEVVKLERILRRFSGKVPRTLLTKRHADRSSGKIYMGCFRL